MAENVSQLLPPTIKLKLAPYDHDERAKLEKLPQWNQLKPIIDAGEVAIPKEVFLRYSLFRQLDVILPSELTDLILSRERLISRVLVSNGPWLGVSERCDPTRHRSEAEDIGEALGLCTGDSIFGPNDLDWDRIQEGKKKTLDTVCSTESLRVEWESKGTFVDDSSLKPQSVGNHKASIEAKKSSLPNSNPSSVVRIGSIAVIGKNPKHPSVIYLVDPPVDIVERTPSQLRVIHRTYNIASLVSLIKDRSPFAAALQTRSSALDSLSNPSELDRSPLLNGSGEEFSVGVGEDGIHSRFFSA